MNDVRADEPGGFEPTEWKVSDRGFTITLFTGEKNQFHVPPRYEYRWTENGIEARCGGEHYRMVIPKGVPYVTGPLRYRP